MEGWDRLDCDEMRKYYKYLQIFLPQVFLINEVGSDVFLRRVQQFEASNCL